MPTDFMPGRKVRTLIVDDSNFVRTMLRAGLSQDPRIEVIGFAADGIEALAKIQSLKPDVVTLDMEMPRLNGMGVLEHVVGKAPVSFVVVSTLTKAGAAVTLEALQKGAFDYVTKPKAGELATLPHFKSKLVERVLAAARSKGRTRNVIQKAMSAAPKLPPCAERGWVVAIGISCGGPQTLTQMLPTFPSDFVPIVITQHMPYPFTSTFAAGLDNICAANVKEAADGDKLERGLILIARGTHHLRVMRRGVDLRVHLDDGPKESLHKPSVDVMFSSVARSCGPRSIGVVMTGMGEDGSEGIVELHRTGAWTIAQDQQTSLVYGMPKAAVATGCVDHQLPLSKIPEGIVTLMKRGVRQAAHAEG
ncbi:MAG TPA: chemotaxis response regulator protein-glutamate methylesterase [Phycisphaerae bacterium]|nr:chemotaxis response regulator protein-glutamate methylesterase [Phycisphaerae bacterium]